MKPNVGQAVLSLRGQGSPAGSSYILYVELLLYCSVPLIDAQRRFTGQGTPAENSYTLYVELLTLLLGNVNRCAEESSPNSVPCRFRRSEIP